MNVRSLKRCWKRGDKLEAFKLKEIAAACGCTTALDGEITKISIDSRDIDENTLFVAIKGARFDANDFVGEVLEKGAKAVVCSRFEGSDKRVMLVEDTGKALLDIACCYRKHFMIPFICLTGSVGKTTTKGMVFSVVSEKYNTLRTIGNLNNEIGMPKTLFNLDNSYGAAVIEMGMNHFGEISRLSQTALPDIGIITNVGTAHIENLGSREGILKAKCEILDGMADGAPLIINGDNDMLATLGDLSRPVYRFGIDGENLYMKAVDIEEDADGSRFNAICGDECERVTVNEVGRHNVYNALCAMCVGKLLGYTLKEAAKGVAEFVPEGMRQKITKVKDYVFIEDCYNANPDSMHAAISALNTVKTARSIAVLSDMLELGAHSDEAHREIGGFAAKAGTDAVLTFGEAAALISEAAAQQGVKTARHFENKDELTLFLKEFLKPGDTVLFKGSRSMKTEEIFQTLYKEWNV